MLQLEGNQELETLEEAGTIDCSSSLNPHRSEELPCCSKTMHCENKDFIQIITLDSSDCSLLSSSIDCPICLQTCIHPARLPCGHIFCFLCVKGVANKNRRCAMCRKEIPIGFLDHPQLLNCLQENLKRKSTEDDYQWFYEGRNGWWQYDERTSQDIEEAYKKREKSFTILVAGYVYVIDFEGMFQQRQNEPTRKRHVKRDLASIPKKGVAGLRIEENLSRTDSNCGLSNTSSFNSINNSPIKSLIPPPVSALSDGFSEMTISPINPPTTILNRIINNDNYSMPNYVDQSSRVDDSGQESNDLSSEITRATVQQNRELLEDHLSISVNDVFEYDSSAIHQLRETLSGFRSLALLDSTESGSNDCDEEANEKVIL